MQKYRNQFLLGLGFVALVLIGIILFFNARELAEQLDHFLWWLLIPMVLLKLINWTARYLEWHYFLGVIGVKVSANETTALADSPDSPAHLNLSDSIIIWTAGLPVAISPGKVAEILKSFVLKNMTGVALARSIPVVFAERLVDGIAVILLAAVSGIFISESVLNNEDLSAGYVQGVLIGTILFLMALLIVVQFRPVAYKFFALIGKLPVIGRFENAIKEFYESSYEIVKLRHLLPTVGLGTIGYFCDGVAFYLVLIGLGQSHSLTLFNQSIFILGFSVIVAALSAMPGGAGGRELTVGALLTAMTTMSSSAIGVALVMVGFLQIWFGTLIGLVIIFIFRKRLFTPALTAEIAAYEHQKESAKPVQV